MILTLSALKYFRFSDASQRQFRLRQSAAAAISFTSQYYAALR
jgi:hypothetical protein